MIATIVAEQSVMSVQVKIKINVIKKTISLILSLTSKDIFSTHPIHTC